MKSCYKKNLLYISGMSDCIVGRRQTTDLLKILLKGSLDEVVTRFLERITTTKANAIRGEIFMTGTAELLSPSHLFFLTKFNKVNQDSLV